MRASNKGGVATSVSSAAFPLLAPDGTAAAPSYSFSSSTNTGWYSGGANQIWGVAGGANVLQVGNNFIQANSTAIWGFTSGGLGSANDSSFSRISAGLIGMGTGAPGSFAGSLKLTNVQLAGKTTLYNGVSTAGYGTPSIVAAGRATAQVAANASVSTFTVGAADGSFEVSANVLVTTATTHSFTVTCAYTSEDNVARVATFSFESLAGAFTTTVINTAGAVPYEGVPLHIRCKASTTITIASAAGGTYTTVVYNIEGIIKQTA